MRLPRASACNAGANVGEYTDGTYAGSAAGYHGTTGVSVTVANGYITDVHVDSTGDDVVFFNQAKAQVIPAIISTQSVDVDAVSGATFSSFGLIDAVINALSGALLQQATSEPVSFAVDTSLLTPEPALTPTPSPVPTPTPSPTPTATIPLGPISLANGEYSGTGRGHRGDIDVTVTVVDGFITDVHIDRYRDTERYFARAKSKTIDRVISAQDVNVDTVSGATHSSRGILEAIADALGLS